MDANQRAVCPRCWPCATNGTSVDAYVKVVYWEDPEGYGDGGDFHACHGCFTKGTMLGRYAGTTHGGTHFRAYPVGEASP